MVAPVVVAAALAFNVRGTVFVAKGRLP